LSWIKGGITLGIILGLAYTHVLAYNWGKDAERRDALERSIKLLRDRKETDETIRNMGDADLCAALHGRFMPDGSCQ